MAASLIDIVANLGAPRVLVVGDLILDRYVWGNAERISQEAPVILLRADCREERLGGSASVSTMLAALGAKVSLAGVLGADAPAVRCRQLLDEHGIEHELVLADPGRPTTLKERYMGRAQQRHPQQMLRVDYEVRGAIEVALANRLTEGLEARLAGSDVVLVSDYDKGVCTPPLLGWLIKACRDRGVRILVDPIRGGDYSLRYHGCSAMTPNRLEAELATGIPLTDCPRAFEAAEQLKRRLEMEVGIVTLDRDGMVLVDQAGGRQHFPVHQREVYDITGAGDMVLAVLGMVVAAGYSYPEAIALANTAGGLEVQRQGVVTVTRAEIIDDLLLRRAGPREKLVTRDILARELDRHRHAGRKVVFTNGCFDVLHAGHIHYLREARAQGDLLVVGLNTDASLRRLGKGALRPINDETSRAAVLGGLELVDYVCLFDEATPLELIKLVRPDVLVKGADYRPEEVVGREFVEAIGGRLHLAALVPGQSTTAIINRIRAGRGAA